MRTPRRTRRGRGQCRGGGLRRRGHREWSGRCHHRIGPHRRCPLEARRPGGRRRGARGHRCMPRQRRHLAGDRPARGGQARRGVDERSRREWWPHQLRRRPHPRPAQHHHRQHRRLRCPAVRGQADAGAHRTGFRRRQDPRTRRCPQWPHARSRRGPGGHQRGGDRGLRRVHRPCGGGPRHDGRGRQ